MANDYGNVMGIACPGALSDSSDYNIDHGVVEPEYEHERQVTTSGEVLCGKIVNIKRIVDGYKEISCDFTSGKYDIAYGVAFRDPLATYVDHNGQIGYAPSEPISVVTHGRVWVLSKTSAAPTPHAHVYVTNVGYASHEGDTEIYGWSFTGRHVKLDNETYMMEVQVKQSAGHMRHDKFTKVNGIHLTKSVEGDRLKYNTVFTVSAEVSPIDATDKTGKWTLDVPIKGTIKELSDSKIEFTPASGFIGDVHIIWTANDGSGVQGMIEVTYIP